MESKKEAKRFVMLFTLMQRNEKTVWYETAHFHRVRNRSAASKLWCVIWVHRSTLISGLQSTTCNAEADVRKRKEADWFAHSYLYTFAGREEVLQCKWTIFGYLIFISLQYHVKAIQVFNELGLVCLLICVLL